jgi:Iap family predicted aminopeptidase
MRRLLCLLVATGLIAGCAGGDEPETKQAPSPAITRAELTAHLAALQRIANRNGGNRSAGTPGFDASADYVAGRLTAAGWNVRRQPVPFTYWRLRRASLAIAGHRLTRAKQFQVLSYSHSGAARGRLRASNDGCAASDFAGLRSGQVPLVDRGDCFFSEKARNAERAGAPALIVVESVSSRRGIASGTLATPGFGIPVVLLSLPALRGGGDGSRVRLKVDALSREDTTENVIAETPGGSGDRIVMAGGHLDSVAGGPGLNDNGSGAATLIEAAEAIGARPPGARVRVAFWGAEELGLHGSRYYVNSLDPAERDRIRAYINLDMVGSPNAVPALYADAAHGLARVLRQAAGGHLARVRAGLGSDHAPFAAAGIPVNGLYTGSTEAGPHGRPRDPCYHLACDTIHNVNRPAVLRLARVAARALRTLSERHR